HIVTLENALSAARLKLESAHKSEQMARRDKEFRQGLVDVVARATVDQENLQESGSMSLAALAKADDELKKAQATFDQADRRRKEADALSALRREDFDYYRDKLNLEQLKEREARVDEARKNATQAEEVLARNKVDSQALRAIEQSERGLLAANAQLETGAPSVLLRGLTQCRLQIDDAAVVLDKDETRMISVPDRARVTVPEVLYMELTAGSSTEGLSKKAAEARSALESACKAAGVGNPDEARRAFDERKEAVRSVESKGQVEKENLRDLSFEELAQLVIGLEKRVSDYPARRLHDPSLCPDRDSARMESVNAESAQKNAAQEWETAQRLLGAARNVRDGLNAKHLDVRVQLDMLTRELHHARENLDRARRATPDDMLDANLADAARVMAGHESDVKSADSSLQEKNPEKVRVLAETAKGSLLTTKKSLIAAQDEMT
ncbi:MAG: hypothetical protein NTU41_02050, partial [Chloroflexi bacterium]|nr:hypothetical protein [Chloroflexota bacterium]